MTGPNVGPEKTREMQNAIATPRLAGLQQSVMMPPRTAMGATPKKPERNRPMKMVARLWPWAGIKVKREDNATPPIKGYLRPNFSDKGPKRRGPHTYPSKYREVPNIVTSSLTANSCATASWALAKMLLPIVATRLNAASMNVGQVRRIRDQLCG